MDLVVGPLIIAVILVVIVHFYTRGDMPSSIGPGSEEYQEFLKKGRKSFKGVSEIPAPPSGSRDLAVEKLLKSGRIEEVRGLLGHRMEDARMAPVGREKRMADVNHYLNLLH